MISWLDAAEQWIIWRRVCVCSAIFAILNDIYHMFLLIYSQFRIEAIRIPAEGYRHAVDFWSIGCVLYEMLTGTVPFVADIDFANDPHEQHFLLLHILYFEPSYDYYCFREDLIAKHFLKMLLEKSPTKRLGNYN